MVGNSDGRGTNRSKNRRWDQLDLGWTISQMNESSRFAACTDVRTLGEQKGHAWWLIWGRLRSQTTIFKMQMTVNCSNNLDLALTTLKSACISAMSYHKPVCLIQVLFKL
jgi:hypothetical protein